MHACAEHTVCPSDLAPDHPNVGAPNLTLRPVDESNLLAEVEAAKCLVPILPVVLFILTPVDSLGSFGGVNTIDLDQTVKLSELSARPIPSLQNLDRSYLVLALRWCFERW